MIIFPCNQCGQCCRNVYLAEVTNHLDRGDGACRHYDDQSKLCSIYETRPDICRVELQYDRNYSSQYSWTQFVELNQQVCQALTEQAPKLEDSVTQQILIISS